SRQESPKHVRQWLAPDYVIHHDLERKRQQQSNGRCNHAQQNNPGQMRPVRAGQLQQRTVQLFCLLRTHFYTRPTYLYAANNQLIEKFSKLLKWILAALLET